MIFKRFVYTSLILNLTKSLRLYLVLEKFEKKKYEGKKIKRKNGEKEKMKENKK